MKRAMVSMDVWGDYACFTRPDAKVERVSYDIMTPSAARGALEAIFWKPEMKYRIAEIQVCKPIEKINVLRNEIKNYQNPKGNPIITDTQRVQRNSVILTDVYYRIKAWIELRPHATEDVEKYRAQFDRRIQNGQCFKRPFLGTREFSAFFSQVDKNIHPIGLNLDLGVFLFDIAFVPSKNREELSFASHDSRGFKRLKGYQQAVYLNGEDALLRNGVLKIPETYYQKINVLEGVS